MVLSKINSLISDGLSGLEDLKYKVTELPFLKKEKKDGSEPIKILRTAETLSSQIGYQFTPSFIKSLNRYGTVLKVTNKYGTNRGHRFGWFVNMIPEITVEGVKGYLIETDKLIPQNEQVNILKENVEGGKATYENGTVINANETQSETNVRIMRINDYGRTSVLDGINQPIIDCKLSLLIVGDDPNAIVYQIERLQTLYKDKVTGITLEALGGEQEELFKNIFEPPTSSIYDYTFMSSDFAGNDHAIRKGLDDPNGWAIGSMAMSYAKGEAFMTLNDSFKKHILIASHKESMISGYDEEMPSSSMWGQLISNNALVEGYKTYHIVMNGFDYYGEMTKNSKFYCPPKINKYFEKVDLSMGGLNPLEMFGDLKDVHSIYNKNLTKIAEMFYLQSNRKLDEIAKTKLVELLNSFYISQKLWHRQADRYPERTRVLGASHDQYPTMGDFVNDMTNAVTKAKKVGTDSEVERLELLHSILKNSLDSYSQIFNQITSLSTNLEREENYYQHYYSLSKLRTEPNIMEAQFLNTFDYVTQKARKGDIIMIHGMNLLSIETLDLIKHRLDLLSEQGIRLAYLFDTVGSGEVKRKVETADIFNTDGLLYDSFEGKFDYTIMGTMTKRELDLYEKKIDQKLTKELKTILTTGSKNQFQIRRPSDLTSNLVLAEFVI